MSDVGPAPSPAGRPTRARALVVVPTLGRRLGLLERTLASIRSQSLPADVVVVAPRDAKSARGIASSAGAVILDDPGGQSAAINLGINTWGRHDYVTWLGDDDTLTPGSLESVSSALDAKPNASAAFGQCLYVDEKDAPLWLSKAGRGATWILPWGPNLVPQPGILIRRAAWEEVGGLDPSLRYTMDMDLLLRLRRWGPLISVPRVVSAFRWHVDSLTVSQRTASLAEGEMVKRRYLPKPMIPLAPAWEAPVRWVTRRAAARISKRAPTRQA